MVHHYRLYGLNFQSNRELTLLPARPAEPPDLLVHWCDDRADSPDARLPWNQILTHELRQRRGIELFHAETDQGRFRKLRYQTAKAHVDFLLSPSRQQLWILYSPDDSAMDLESYFVGPGLGCILRWCGTVCLHASVVRIDDQAIAVVGKKKAGKSTTAAGLGQLGALIMSDDMAVLTPVDQSFLVHPGYPQVRLWPASIAAIFPDAGTLPKVFSHRDKRYLPLKDAQALNDDSWSRPATLSAVYVLDRTDSNARAPYVDDLNPQNRLMTLVANTFGSYVVTDDLRRKEFQVLARLSNTIRLRRVVFGDDLKLLPAQSQAILDDFRGQPTPTETRGFDLPAGAF